MAYNMPAAWIPVTDAQRPPPDTPVLVATDEGYYDIAVYVAGPGEPAWVPCCGCIGYDADLEDAGTVTHWMPLPELPS
jgi:hypothetical protein